MRHEMAMTRNVRRFLFAVSELTGRPRGIEGMGLLWGAPGEGKSTTVAFCANATDGVFVRANSCWTVTSMLAALSVELSREPKRTRAPMMEAITESLMGKPRPIF
ncbi:MAG: ATP-binding protein, partial [Pseudomonadota bacterium]